MHSRGRSSGRNPSHLAVRDLHQRVAELERVRSEIEATPDIGWVSLFVAKRIEREQNALGELADRL